MPELSSPFYYHKSESVSRSVMSDSLWTTACQALLSMGFSRQEYWSGLPFPSPGDFPNPGIEPILHISHIAGGFLAVWVTREAQKFIITTSDYISFSKWSIQLWSSLSPSYGHHQHFCHAPIFPAQNFQESKYTVGSEKTDGPRLV